MPSAPGGRGRFRLRRPLQPTPHTSSAARRAHDARAAASPAGQGTCRDPRAACEWRNGPNSQAQRRCRRGEGQGVDRPVIHELPARLAPSAGRLYLDRLRRRSPPPRKFGNRARLGGASQRGDHGCALRCHRREGDRRRSPLVLHMTMVQFMRVDEIVEPVNVPLGLDLLVSRPLA